MTRSMMLVVFGKSWRVVARTTWRCFGGARRKQGSGFLFAVEVAEVGAV